VPKPTAERIRRAARTNSRIRIQKLEGLANELAGIFVGAQNRIAELLIREPAGAKISPIRAEALSAEIDQIVQLELTQPANRWVSQNINGLMETGIQQGARAVTAQSTASVFNAVPKERVRTVFLTFTDTEDYSVLVGQSFKQWLAEIQATDQAMVESMRRALTEGAALGLTNDQITENLMSEGQIRPLVTSDGRRIDAATRAKGIVRTEGIRSIVASETAVNNLAGLRAFVDVGVRDEVTSAECRVAQRQVPHTIAWWKGSPMGVPPRHIKNCRDEMMAVDLATFTIADARALGIRGYDPATFQLDGGSISRAEFVSLQKQIRDLERMAA